MAIDEDRTPLYDQERTFLFMAGYRWASLTLVFLTPATEGLFIVPTTVLAFAIIGNLLITLAHKQINEQVTLNPSLIIIDVVQMAAILTLTGGVSSPYFLFALSPLLASAFFFGARRAILNAATFTPLFIAAELIFKTQKGQAVVITTLVSALIHLWLMTLVFSYSSRLLRRLRKTHVNLEDATQEISRSHRQLKIVHELSVLIQSASDIQSVQSQVLSAVTDELGYSCAAVALVDPVSEMLGNWASCPEIPMPEEGMPALPLNLEYGPLIENLYKKESFYLNPKEKPTSNPIINQWLGERAWVGLPMILQDHPVGVLMIELGYDAIPPTEEEIEVFRSVANQAAIGLGTTLMCIDRARNLAIEQERNRFAREIHDTVAQSLFGMNYSLEAIINMMGEDLPEVKKELLEVQEMANASREEIRNSIFNMWPSQLTLDKFVADLELYAKQFCRPRNFDVTFNTSGNFDDVPQGIRRSLYRIAQEAITNTTQHSGAASAQIGIAITDNKIHMQIVDEGQGFDPKLVMNRAYNRERFGLHGIRERVQAINGEFNLESAIGKGTKLEVSIPLTIH